MQKQDLIGKIAEISVTGDLKEQLMSRIELYPEQLGEKHLEDFDALIDSLEADELRGMSILQTAIQKAKDGIEQEEFEYNQSMSQIQDEAQRISDEMNKLTSSQS